jgi:hypothetical protein
MADYTMYTREEILEALAGLEKEGLIEWTGEWRPARDGTLQKVYRAATKGRSGKAMVNRQ